MRMRQLVLLIIIFFAESSFSNENDQLLGGKLSENIIIKSEILGYHLQYRVYTPKGMNPNILLPTIYITDGEAYIKFGQLPALLDKEISANRIEPVIAVFVDARNPEKMSENRRDSQFICNENYAKFYAYELLPAIEKSYPSSPNREARVIMGLSYGAYNAACFGLFLPDYFAGLAMQSPAKSYLVRRLTDIYKKGPKLPLKIFLSHGRKGDSTRDNRSFKNALTEKGYDLTYKQSYQGHNWSNWRPLLDDVLLTFFETNN